MILKKTVSWAMLIVILIVCTIFSAITSQLLSKNASAQIQSDSIYVPIIVYHDVKPKTTSYTITPYEFEDDLKYLAANDYSAITMSDLVDFVYYGKALPQKPIILSFDDGYLDNYKYVYPLIKKYNVKIVLSIIAKNTDDFTRIPDDNLEYSHVTWDQLNEMIRSGLVDVQNHTYDLHSCKKGRIGCMQKRGESDSQYEKVLTEDLSKCQEEIKTNTGVTPNTFTYPYGRLSKDTDQVIRKLGFKATLSCNYGVNVISRNPDSLFDLKRICRMHRIKLEKALQDGFKTLKFRKTGSEIKEEETNTEHAMAGCEP